MAEQIGETRICKWKEDRQAAFSIGGDDSLRSQLYFAIPEMDRKGIRGTWWVNPGLGGPVNFKNEDDAWAQCWIACYADWVRAAGRGHDFANHTLHHLGAASYAQAEQEIGGTARAIWEANPRQRLQLFDRGGGTTWQITELELAEILARYDCVEGRGGSIEDPTWEVNPNADTLRGYVETALREGSWHHVAFHGIGPSCEWGGPVDGAAFIALLDYLVEKRAHVWAGTHTEVHKYSLERDHATVTVLDASSRKIILNLTSSTIPLLYDYPLTLVTKVPDSWKKILLNQGNNSIEYPVVSGEVHFDAKPDFGNISIEDISLIY